MSGSLLSILGCSWRFKRWNVVVHVFFDDSGKLGGDGDFVCMAGYIADGEAWDNFTNKWALLLLKHGLPYIHMREFIPLKGVYRNLNWDNTRRDEVLAEFIDLIREHVIAGFGIGVDAKYFRSMSKDVKRELGDPHMFCFQRILRVVVKKLRSVGYEGTMSPIFDDCEQYSTRCYRMWSRWRVKEPDFGRLVPSITFADDKVYAPLQAADILAWESHKQLKQEAANYKPRKQFERLMQSTTPGYGLDYGSEVWEKSGLDELYRLLKSGELKV